MATLVRMTSSKAPVRPLLEESDACILIGIINRIVEALDPAELSVEEALVVYLVLDRAMGALWREFARELILVYGPAIMASNADDDESNGSDGDPEN
jgi:hypothetical protein